MVYTMLCQAIDDWSFCVYLLEIQMFCVLDPQRLSCMCRMSRLSIFFKEVIIRILGTPNISKWKGSLRFLCAPSNFFFSNGIVNLLVTFRIDKIFFKNIFQIYYLMVFSSRSEIQKSHFYQFSTICSKSCCFCHVFGWCNRAVQCY